MPFAFWFWLVLFSLGMMGLAVWIPWLFCVAMAIILWYVGCAGLLALNDWFIEQTLKWG